MTTSMRIMSTIIAAVALVAITAGIFFAVVSNNTHSGPSAGTAKNSGDATQVVAHTADWPWESPASAPAS